MLTRWSLTLIAPMLVAPALLLGQVTSVASVRGGTLAPEERRQIDSVFRKYDRPDFQFTYELPNIIDRFISFR